MITIESLLSGPADVGGWAAPLVNKEANPMPGILVVEDEAHIRQFVAVNLKARG